ncbi:TPA: internalin, partial [Acinetobacter baumannii]|nr:internalin [Acinetobacter baumannii]
MANKKLLICAAIAAGLLLTACVKKETPKEEEQDKVETAVSEPQPQKPAKFESLESVDTQEAQVQEQPQVEVHREETANTTTEIRRETRPARSDESSQTQVAEQPKSETPKVEPKPEKKP